MKTLRDLLYWQYAKLISKSVGFGKANYAFTMDRFKRLQSGDLDVVQQYYLVHTTVMAYLGHLHETKRIKAELKGNNLYWAAA